MTTRASLHNSCTARALKLYINAMVVAKFTVPPDIVDAPSAADEIANTDPAEHAPRTAMPPTLRSPGGPRGSR